MRRIASAFAMVVFFLSNEAAIAANPTQSNPNVIFIMADDLGYGDFSCYGATKVQTPHCDRLAAEGMRFTDAHSPSAVCTPTRYSVLTGRYCWRTWLKNWVLMPEHPLLVEQDRLTMGKLFQKYGYRTGCVGKWHLGWGTQPNIDFNGEVKPGRSKSVSTRSLAFRSVTTAQIRFRSLCASGESSGFVTTRTTATKKR